MNFHNAVITWHLGNFITCGRDQFGCQAGNDLNFNFLSISVSTGNRFKFDAGIGGNSNTNICASNRFRLSVISDLEAAIAPVALDIQIVQSLSLIHI